MHQAAIAVCHLSSHSSSVFWSYTKALMAHQADYFDEPTVDETPNATKQRLASDAEKWTQGAVKASDIFDLIVAKEGNKGSKVDADLKLQVKYHRQNSVHVTPTVALDGIIDPSVSSSFGKDEWTKWLDEKVTN